MPYEDTAEQMAKLVEPGWPGVLTLIEAQYIASQLATDPALRRRWHIRKRKRYPLQLIAERAFPEDPAEGRRLMENLLQVQTAARARSRNAQLGEKQGVRVSNVKER